MGNFSPAASRAGAGPIGEIDVLWLTAGLGCDGDTIAATAATQPSIEDIVRGTFPWIPKVNFHNPFLAYDRSKLDEPRRALNSMRKLGTVAILAAMLLGYAIDPGWAQTQSPVAMKPTRVETEILKTIVFITVEASEPGEPGTSGRPSH